MKFPMSNAPPLSFVLGPTGRMKGVDLIEGIFTDATVDDGLYLIRRMAQLPQVTSYAMPKILSDARS